MTNRWRAHHGEITKHSQPIRQEMEALRAIDDRLPFAVLTILIEHELQREGTDAGGTDERWRVVDGLVE